MDKRKAAPYSTSFSTFHIVDCSLQNRPCIVGLGRCALSLSVYLAFFMDILSPFAVGCVVRVRSRDGTRSVRAVVSYSSSSDSSADQAAHLYDVEYIGSYRESESEGGVHASRVLPLLDFESQHFETASLGSGSKTSCNVSVPSDTAPDKIKEWGNALFKLGDFDAALQYYRAALTALHRAARLLPLSVGSPVLVMQQGSGEAVIGMISGTSDDAESNDAKSSEAVFDILYENDIDYARYGTAWEEPVEEEEGVRASVLIPALPCTAKRSNLESLSSSSSNGSIENPLVLYTELLVSLHLNMAKSFVKFRMHGWSLRHVTIAKGHMVWAIYSGGSSGADDVDGGAVWRPGAEARLRDVIHLRARMFLEANRPGRCIKDAEVLATLGDASRSAALVRQARDLAERTRRSNRALVREVVRWVDSAMAAAPSSSALAGAEMDAEVAPDVIM